ncbi:MAG: DUF4956 domain-containing protein [Gemmatimonadota bacterium]
MQDDNKALPNGADRRQTPESPGDAEVRPGQRLGPERKGSFLRLAGYYLLLIGIGIALLYWSPLIRTAWVSAPEFGAGAQLEDLTERDALTLDARAGGPGERAVTVLFITLGALLISLPVAWVYTLTRRLRYDPSLVHSVIILPMVVSAIVIVVKDSVALAFSLAGIVAVVRFRNTLKDPKDAVYIFLALGIGLAAGIQALDIALAMSLAFNAVILVLWKYNLGEIYGETARDLFAVGNRDLMIARNASQRDAIRWRVSREARDMATDGILLVHTSDPEAARQSVELALGSVADDWRVVDKFRRRNGTETFAVLMRLKDKKGDPLALLGEIDERWARQIDAAEYVPFKKAAQKDEE